MRGFIAFALATSLGAACSSDKRYTVEFDAVVNGQPFSCTQAYSGIGTTMTTIHPLDFRMYVHDVALVHGGVAEPLALDEDGTWQHDGVAYLDFEDGTGTCMTNSPQTNIVVKGRAPEHSYDAVQFVLGVPADQDHLDVVTAQAPLNNPLMFWSWSEGYKYVKLEVESTGQPDYFFHLGAMDCDGAGSSVTCTYPNLASVPLSSFDAGTSHVQLDLARLYATSNLDAEAGPDDPTEGCMSSDGDPQCPPLFEALGLSFQSNTPGPTQVVFQATSTK